MLGYRTLPQPLHHTTGQNADSGEHHPCQVGEEAEPVRPSDSDLRRAALPVGGGSGDEEPHQAGPRNNGCDREQPAERGRHPDPREQRGKGKAGEEHNAQYRVRPAHGRGLSARSHDRIGVDERGTERAQCDSGKADGPRAAERPQGDAVAAGLMAIVTKATRMTHPYRPTEYSLIIRQDGSYSGSRT